MEVPEAVVAVDTRLSRAAVAGDSAAFAGAVEAVVGDLTLPVVAVEAGGLCEDADAVEVRRDLTEVVDGAGEFGLAGALIDVSVA